MTAQLAALLMVITVLFNWTAALAAAPFHVSAEGASFLPPVQPPPEVCEHYLARFFNEPGWRDKLMNPVYTEESQLLERYNLYLPVHDCLANSASPLTEEQAEARELTGYFLTLVGGIIRPVAGQAGQGGLVRLDSLEDPAVSALRNEVGLPVPEGYLYVWLYPSRDDLPENLRDFFSAPGIRGLTLLTRYIVVLDSVAGLDEAQRGTRLEDYQRDQRDKVFSHEYVHAYIKSLLGPERAFGLPDWYDEGLAIYFSGSSEPSSQIYLDEGGRQVWITTAPEEYAAYRDMFQYLEQQYGRERFLELLRESVLQADPDLLYRDLDARDEQEILVRAEESREEQGLRRLTYIVLSIIAAALLIFMIRRMIAREPQRVPEGVEIAASRSVNSVPEPVRARQPAVLSRSPPVSRRQAVQQPAVSQPAPARLAPQPVYQEQANENRPRPGNSLSAVYMGARGNLRGLESMLVRTSQSLDTEAVQARLAAVEALANLRDPRSVELLVLALRNDASSTVRAAAARGLGKLGDLQNLDAPLDALSRNHALAALFPAFHNDLIDEVRMRAAEAIYQVGGTAVLRPLESGFRREARARRLAPGVQRWLANWGFIAQLETLLIGLYPWLDDEARHLIAGRLRWRLTPEILLKLEQAAKSGDPDLQELAEAVLGSGSHSP